MLSAVSRPSVHPCVPAVSGEEKVWDWVTPCCQVDNRWPGGIYCTPVRAHPSRNLIFDGEREKERGQGDRGRVSFVRRASNIVLITRSINRPGLVLTEASIYRSREPRPPSTVSRRVDFNVAATGVVAETTAFPSEVSCAFFPSCLCMLSVWRI